MISPLRTPPGKTSRQRRFVMRTRIFLPGLAGFAVMLVLAASDIRSLAQENPVALAGQVRSTAEGLMEGVVVSAKKAGSTVTVSVISDARGQLQLSSEQTGAGSVFAQCPRRRIRDGRSRSRRRDVEQDCHHQSHAAQGERPLLPAHECGVDVEHAWHRRSKGPSAHVCRLPHARTHRQVQARCGCVRTRVGANGDVYEFELSAARAETTGPMAAPAARRGAPAVPAADGRIPQHDQFELRLDMGVSAQDIPATEGERHAGHHHGIRPAASDHRAARRHRGLRREWRGTRISAKTISDGSTRRRRRSPSIPSRC